MRIGLVLGVSLLTSCSLFDGAADPVAEPESQPRLIGRIASVSAEKDFVLIESYGPWRVPEGGILAGSGTEGRTCNLVVTGERMGQHAAADIRSGEAKVGDSVYYRPLEMENQNENSIEASEAAPVLQKPETQKTESGLPATR